MNRKLLCGALALMLVFSLAACGASSSRAASTAAFMTNKAAPPVPASPAAAPPGAGEMAADAAGIAERGEAAAGKPNGADAALSARKIVRNAALVLETKEFERALSELARMVTDAGGYIESQSVSGVSLRDRGGYNERSASITARVPAERLDAVIASVGGLCNVLSNSSSMDDITDRYFDAKAHLDSLSLQEERLLSILAKAEKLEEVITLEQSLSEVRYQIESLTAQLKRMDSQVSTSALNMELNEVVEYQQVTDPPKSFGERVAAAWSRSVTQVGNWFENLALFVVGDAPVLLLNLALLLLLLWIVWIFWRIIRRGMHRHSDAPTPRVRRGKQPPAPPAPPSDPPREEK